ncbi:MAG: TrkA family potassium uptake protein, partial [Actinomycetota bacterium]|nr:TrkA family potassium uptake protein [Actinomycetota bacterium]
TGHCIICGYGRIGKQVARECKSQGMEVVVIEKDREVEKQCAKEGFLTVRGDAADESVLRQAGIDRAKGLVTALSSDADNLFVTMTARILRPDLFIVGRCNADETESKLYRAGADRAISPHNMGAKYMAALMLKPLVCDFLDVVTHGEPVELSLEGIVIEGGSPVAGRRARDILVGELKSIAILGIKKPKQNFYVNPGGDTLLDAGDIIIVYGSDEQLNELRKLCETKR